MMNETAQQNMENHPVIRTLYDHVDEVTCLAFHPTEQILASGSRDYTLKLFDYSKPSAKRAFKHIQVSEGGQGVASSPRGDVLLVRGRLEESRLSKEVTYAKEWVDGSALMTPMRLEAVQLPAYKAQGRSL